MLGRYIDLGNPVSDHPLNRGLVSWWLPLPNNQGGSRLFDIRGGSHGTLTNGPTWAAGERGFRSLSLVRASSQYVSLARVPDFTSQLTFGCWVNTASTPATDNYHSILSKGRSGAADDRNFGFDYRTSGGSTKLEVFWTSAPSTYVEYYHVVTLDWSRWYYLTWVIDWSTNPDTVTFYIDGVSKGLTLIGSNNASPTTTATQVCLLGSLHTGSDYWNGKLDSPRLYNRALSAAEVWQLYQQSRQGYPDLLRRWGRRAVASPAAPGGFIPFPRPRGHRAGMSALTGGM